MNYLFEWKNKKVRVRTLKPMPQIKNNKISYVKEKSISQIPMWMAIILKKHNIIEIIDEKEIDLVELNKIVWREKNNSSLQPLEEDIYININQYLDQLSEKIQKYPDPKLIEKKDDTVNYLRDLLTYRLYKILRIVEAKNRRVLIKTLTKEEKELYYNIMANFEKWKSEILSENY
ncbi:MAG: hypothetical protein ACTSRG_08920 [Candidatus Helarchaeota archaeon]